jgi:hypothetical protein
MHNCLVSASVHQSHSANVRETSRDISRVNLESKSNVSFPDDGGKEGLRNWTFAPK